MNNKAANKKFEITWTTITGGTPSDEGVSFVVAANRREARAWVKRHDTHSQKTKIEKVYDLGKADQVEEQMQTFVHVLSGKSVQATNSKMAASMLKPVVGYDVSTGYVVTEEAYNNRLAAGEKLVRF